MPIVLSPLRLLLPLALALGATVGDAQTRRVENTALLLFRTAAGEQRASSNTVALEVAAAKPTAARFHLAPPNLAVSCDPATAAAVDAATLAAAPVAVAVDVTTPLILALTAPGENRDPATRETAPVRLDTPGRTAGVVLVETAPDSGLFAAAVPPCALGVRRGDTIRIAFAQTPHSLASDAAQLVDPAGYVFDAATGTVVDGATVTLVDEAGRPALVRGDDGVSAYPASVVSGVAVTDAGGHLYPALPGRYRFPVVPPGRYRLGVEPPPATSPGRPCRARRWPG